MDTFKVKMEFKETSGAKPIHALGTFSVEKSSGDTIESDVTVENLAFGGGPGLFASGKMHSERTSGSPFDARTSPAPASPKPRPLTMW